MTSRLRVMYKNISKSYNIRDPVLLNLLNSLQKRDKMQGKYVLIKVILWKQRMHQRTETRVCKFSGPD